MSDGSGSESGLGEGKRWEHPEWLSRARPKTGEAVLLSS